MEYVATTLNIGGRNTNPLEFQLEGDDSEIGKLATQIRTSAQRAMLDPDCGPASMPRAELEIIHSILERINGEGADIAKTFAGEVLQARVQVSQRP